jgi:hypothetical protein
LEKKTRIGKRREDKRRTPRSHTLRIENSTRSRKIYTKKEDVRYMKVWRRNGKQEEHVNKE